MAQIGVESMKALAILLVMAILCSAVMAQETGVEYAPVPTPAPAPDAGSGAAFLTCSAIMLCSSLILPLLATLVMY